MLKKYNGWEYNYCMRPISYFSFLILIIFTLWFIKAFDISYPLSITTTTKSKELAVVGEGKVDVVPDQAEVSVGIIVSNVRTVDEAQKAINDVNNKIIDAMKNLGIKKKDIKTSSYSISPNYSFESGKNAISGYNGNATLAIKVQNIALFSKVIEEATKSGANEIYGTRFVVDKPERYREEARNKAIENAKEQANKLAKTLGIKLGKVANIVESTPSEPIALRSLAAEGRGGAGAQIEPGTQTITSIVTLYFEKK